MICPTCGSDNLPGADACKHCQMDLPMVERAAANSRLERSLLEDHVSVLSQKSPLTLLPTATVKEAIDLMLTSDIGALLVVDEAGLLVGIFSERDLLKKVAGLHENYADLPISRFMTTKPVCVATTDTLRKVLQRMDGGGYRHVPVTDHGKPVNIISVRDMLHHITKLCQNGK